MFDRDRGTEGRFLVPKLLLDLRVIPSGIGPHSPSVVLPNDDKRAGIIWPIVISLATDTPRSFLVSRTGMDGANKLTLADALKNGQRLARKQLLNLGP